MSTTRFVESEDVFDLWRAQHGWPLEIRITTLAGDAVVTVQPPFEFEPEIKVELGDER